MLNEATASVSSTFSTTMAQNNPSFEGLSDPRNALCRSAHDDISGVTKAAST
jgi:hypothetical protein